MVVLLRAEERRGRVSLPSRVSRSSTEAGSTSAGAMIGDPGVWTSSSMGSGSLGGRVRWYDMSCVAGGPDGSIDWEYERETEDDSVLVFIGGTGTSTGLLG